MKKQQLNFLQLDNVKLLTRSQLKDILGGAASGSGTGGCSGPGQFCNWMDSKCCTGLTCWSTNNPSNPDQGKCINLHP
ncbi:hypothetical protein CLV51_104371 [Chitinophaga niastensis]|uniref:Uncharacterized protein n=1 Tax=Chitinophaga niastensis TaxID=536980 RepID=A0A2P8HHE9_CHINA|nr:hypothetical protein CLV51_104371 [Chitinophaga niastensis]